MVKFFDFADKFNKERTSLKLPIHWIPEFAITVYNFIKGFVKFFLFYAFIFTPFCFNITLIASGSMTPTCLTNEIVLSSQLGYGIKLSKVLNLNYKEQSFFDKTIWKYEDPRVGDIVAFKVPFVDMESVYTKRILALEGDTVQFVNGILIINKKPVSLKFLRNITYVENEKSIVGSVYEETLPNGLKHEVLYTHELGSGPSDNTEEFKVPKGFVFCCGNNRHNSDDSRSLFAFVEKRHILGKVTMVLFSNGNLRSTNTKKFINGIRWNRCLKWMI